jgi:hypothetical protein
LRLGFGIALLFAAAALVDWRRSAQLVLAADRGYLLLAFGLLLADRVVMAFKWNILLRAKDIGLPLPRALALYLAGTFLSSLMPSSLGGDAYRALAAAPRPELRPVAVASVLVERAFGLVAALAVATLGGVLALWLGAGLSPRLVALSFVLLVGAASALAILLHPTPRRLLAVPPRRPWLEPLFAVARGVASYGDRPRALATFFSLTFLEQFLAFSVPLTLARSVGSAVTAPALFACAPLVSIAEALPISLGGLGIRELGFVTLLGRHGMGTEAAFAVSLLTQAGSIAVCLPGALLFLPRARREALARLRTAR